MVESKADMKRIFMMSALAAMAACGEQDVTPAEGSQTGFALSFFRNVNAVTAPEENIVVSPYSAGMVLAMLEAGAEGQTKAELDNALNGAVFGKQELDGGDNTIVQSSNAVWISDNFSVRNRYVSHLENDFGAFIDTQNFSSPSAVNVINDWCAEKTSGKIKKIIERVSPDMVMLLVNALYFNAPWAVAFDADATREAIFHGRNGDTTVPMMARKSMFNYAEYQGAKMIEVPYEGEKYAMYIVLPPSGISPDAFLPYIGENQYKSAMSLLAPKEVVLNMPKFTNETSLILNRTLENMGVRTAFTSAADFSGISVSGPLNVSIVKQKCYIDVTEKGTEAAAVSSAQVRLTAVRPSVTMTVDRPFIFIIADMENKDILFAGKIVNI